MNSDRNARDGFLVCVETFRGQTLMVGVRPSDTVRDLKIWLQVQTNVPIDEMRLVFEMATLEDERTVSECGLKHQSIVHQIRRMIGGAGGGKKEENKVNVEIAEDDEEEEDKDVGENRGRSNSMEVLGNFNCETPRSCQIC